MRTNNKTGEAILIHKRGSKVVGLHCNPVQPDLLLSCGNDHYVSFVICFVLCESLMIVPPSFSLIFMFSIKKNIFQNTAEKLRF